MDSGLSRFQSPDDKCVCIKNLWVGLRMHKDAQVMPQSLLLTQSLSSNKSSSPALAHPLLPLVALFLSALLALDLGHQPLELALVLAVPFALLSQRLPRHETGVLAQLAQGPFALAPVLRLQLAMLSPLPVWVVVAARRVAFLKLRDSRLDRERAMRMKSERSAGKMRFAEEAGEGGEGLGSEVLESRD